MPTDPRPQVVMCVVRRSDVTACKVIQWKLCALLGHLFCPYKLLYSLIVLIFLWKISIVGHKSCPDAECLFYIGRCPFECEKYEGLFRHVKESYACCVFVHLVLLQHLWFTLTTVIWHIMFPTYSHLYSALIFQTAENTLGFVVWETFVYWWIT